MKRLILSTIITALVITGLSCAPRIEYIEVPYPVIEYRTITETEYVDRWHEPEIIIKEVEVIHEVEVVKEVPVETLVFTDNISEWFIPWESVSELRTYVMTAGIAGRTYIKDKYDCDDFARDLSRQALFDRRNIGLFTTVTSKFGSTSGHMMNFAIVGNRIYQIEPQTSNVNPLAGYNYKLD